jgi:beta-lactamase regulating signal transducer with metallopeptidase domain
MILESCLAASLRAAVLLALALAAMPLLRHASAATRRLVLVLAIGGALLLPAVSALAPAWRIGHHSSPDALREPFAEPLAEDGPLLAAVRGAPIATLRAVDTATRNVDLEAVLVTAWAIGAILVAARLAAGLLAARAMVRRASPAPSWARAVAQVERAIGRRADVRMTDDLDAPATTGILAPVVLVPRASQAWTEARRITVLHHELAHIRQMDCLAQILAQLACALYWFNPLPWLVARRLRLERELSADDAVIAVGTRATSYAADLLMIAGGRPTPTGTLGMAERSQLAVRVAAIVSPDRARLPLSRPRAAVVVAGAAAVLFVVACAAPANEAPAASMPASPPLPAAPGAASTIDRRLQQLADEEIDRTVAEWQPAAATIVVLDPRTGEILANAGRAHGARADLALQRAYVIGSTFKPVMLAAALDEGVVTPADRFDCENGARAYGDRILRDAGAYGTLTVPEMLAVSTNVGFSKVFDRLGGDRLGHWLRRFHFGAAPALPGAAAGTLPARIEDQSFEGACVAIGEGRMTATPLQLVAAYAVLANDGIYLAPTLTRRSPAPGEPLLKPSTAGAVVAMLEEAVNSEHATGKAARIAGVRVAGKTGTAAWLPDGSEGTYSSFVGIVPAEHPRFVILVGVESPRGNESGGKVAAPAFARLASRALGG